MPQNFCFSFFLTSFITLTILITPSNGSISSTNYLLTCGASTTLDNNQTWYTDENTTFAPIAAYKAATAAAKATKEESSLTDQAFCSSARLFYSPFTYSFPVSPGPKFVRLYFCAAATYNTTSTEHLFLSLQADGGDASFNLLHNYSAYLHQQQFKDSFAGPMAKEFLVMATTSLLKLTFSPTLVGSLAFVNAIEIVAVPYGLYDYFSSPSVEESGAPSFRSTPCRKKNSVDTQLPIFILGPTAIETVVRLNVGGIDVSSTSDTGGMSRTWYNDDNHLTGNFRGATSRLNLTKIKILYTASVPEYTAPSSVYGTSRVMGPVNDKIKLSNNITWSFSVDYGFQYLVRLHFCEMDPQVTKSGQREFDVFINNKMADNMVDVLDFTDGQRASPVCMDYMVSIYDESANKAYLSLTLRPDVGFVRHFSYHDVILNGLEIFKLNQSDGNLAGPNPAPLPYNTNQPSNGINFPSDRKSAHLLIIEIMVGVLGSAVLIPLTIVLVYCWRTSKLSTIESKKLLASTHNSGSSTTSSGASSLPSHLCKRFTLQQMKLATSNFDDDFVIGVGGFGKVYKGSIAIDGETNIVVAIKRLNQSSKQGAQEFRTEIEMLTALRHMHLVSLIGYCNENSEMMLVYEYMPLGPLQDHLYRTYNTRSDDSIVDNTNYAPMPWKRRLMTCIGAARGLHYLHTGANRVIIHRDVKSSNILLDKNWTAKVSDFGMSKLGPSSIESGPIYISTLVKGSIGYLDPEYLRLEKLTEKSDVYSFGVVLFEVLCARPARSRSLVVEQVNLAKYAQRCYKEDILHEIVDPIIKHEIAPVCLRKFGEIAEKCVRDHGSERPSMEEVVWYLEFALQLQETTENNGVTSSVVANDKGDGNITIDTGDFSTSGDILASKTSAGGTSTTLTSKIDALT